VDAVDGIREMKAVRFQLGQTAKGRVAMTTDCTTPIRILKCGKKMNYLTGAGAPMLTVLKHICLLKGQSIAFSPY